MKNMVEPQVKTLRSGGEVPHWYSPTLWHTMTTSAWFRLLQAHGFRIAPSRLPMAVSVTLTVISNSLMGFAQALIYNRRIAKTQIRDPIFVLGHWRSGTTHLHDLLALDERYAFPTVLECSYPRHCMLTGHLYPKLFGWLLPRKRAMDDMQVAFDRPQEDEIALVALGLPSSYWAVGYGGANKGQAFLTLRDVSEAERNNWQNVLLGFLRLVTLRSNGKRMVLKSPPHTGRLAMLSKLFPEARFLHIVRNPYDVFASTVHLWRRMQSWNALIPIDEEEMENYVLQSLRQMYEDFDAACASLPAGRMHQVRYEELVRDPIGVLEESYRALDLGGFEHVKSRVQKYVASISGYRTNEYALSAAARETVTRDWGSIFRNWGYDI